MSSLEDDDDIIIIEESICTSTTTRRSPLRFPDDTPGPSNCLPFYEEGGSDAPKMMRLDSYERFLGEEDNLTKPSEFRAPSHVKIRDQLSVEVQEVAYGDDEEFIEPSEKKKRKVPKKVLSEVQLQKQAEKRRKAIEREISASIKSKCEQYMFCHVSRRIFDEFPETEIRTRMLFAERNIHEQLICDEDRPDMQVLWYRKCIEAVEVDGTVDKREYFAPQHIFAVVLTSDSLKELIRSKSIEDFVAAQKLSYSVSNSTLVLIVFGKDSHQLFSFSIELFDCYRTQLHYVNSAQEFATYLAQISRALAKMERSLAHRDRLIVDVEKGIKDAPPDELVRDWWNKMLAVICRMQDGQRRAIVAAYPNPLLASKRFLEMGYTLAVRELSELQTEAGRRLGPVMAHRLFMILTDVSGTEIVG
ncbi:hypothetical protein V3C99_004984 [Haemonchus contortus]